LRIIYGSWDPRHAGSPVNERLPDEWQNSRLRARFAVWNLDFGEAFFFCVIQQCKLVWMHPDCTTLY